MAQKLEQQLSDLGSKLEQPPSTKDALVKLLKQAATCLSELDQTPATSILDSMQPLLNAVVKPELLKHQDKDVKLLVATCICEITRITAPDAPYSDDILKDIFCLIVSTFGGLRDTSGLSFGRRVVILETVAKYRSCVVMLDLECDDLVKEMFNTFFSVASDEHPESVISSMQTIMAVLLEESEDIQEDLLFSILSVLGRNKKDVTMAARKLAMNVIEQCAGKLEADIKQFLISSMSGDSKTVKYPLDYHEVIYDVYRCTPLILSGVVPYITGELLTDQLETRLKAVGLVGDLFALPGSVISEAFQPIFSEFLKRLTDRVVEVRMSVLEHVKSCLLSNPLRDEAPQIISALCDRLLDFDENVRKQVVAVISDVACHALSSVPHETVKLVAERLRDKSLLVKKYTLERLADIYRVYCMKCADGSMTSYEYDWIPGKILRSFYDKDFRSDVIESVLCGSLFPNEFSIKDKVRHWVRLFSGFDKVEIKALEKVLEQKQRLQQEMQRYLSFRQMYQDGDAPEIQKKVLFCFRIMSRSFADPAKAEENFLSLDQLKDANIWKILTNLVDSNTSFHQASAFRDDLLKILGEKHRLYDFLSTLSVKSSYLLFDKEHVKELLLEAAAHKSSENLLNTSSCMNMLVILARFSPMLLSGAEEELINFLKEDDEVIREGVLHVLAKAGGTIREQLAVSSSSIDLMLEKVCLEGSRRQAKYAVHALAAITKDDGLKSLSVLYKKLVDMLEEKTHLPAVLQSLGCIAQTAMPVFETRETQIEEFILNKILKCNSKPEGGAKASWDKRSDICSLKIFGIKTLVKSYLPVKDAHVRSGIDGLVEILRNILSFGEISNDIESSPVDKAHLRLASAKAVLRLSKHWDHKIPVDVFHLTLRTSEISYLEAKRLFLSKVHQYIKDRLLDGKYACAFLLDIFGSKPADFQEEKQNLADIIQMYHQTKARQHNIQNDANSLTAYPEYLLPYLVHALAHHSCPNVDECKDVKAFEVLYRQLYLILSMLVHRDEDVKSEANNTAVQESIFAIVSIFKSIKQSEDIVVAMSKNSYAICDLGLSITKCLAPKEYEELGLTASVPLPTVMYKPYEKKGEEDSVAGEGETWLADESVLAHFASLKLETSETLVPETAENDLLKQGEKDGNEVPLGKMIKHLKSQGTKGKKVKKEKSSSAEVGNAGNAVDILGMVREINVDNLGKSNKFESTNGHEHSPSKKSRTDLKHQKGEKRKAIDATPVPVPKRKRSLSGQSASKGRSSSSKALTNNINERKSLMNSGSDLLASCFQKNISSSFKRKGKGLDQSRKDEPNETEEVSDHEKSNVLMEMDKTDRNSDIQLSTGLMKKRKRNSMPGLTKSKFKESGKDVEELIGCKIKVWWPMDKQFYEGTVKSYDTKKNKHVVLYDDGDVEVLRLEKERWELIDNGRKTKKLNSSKSPPSRKRSGGKVKSSGGSVQDKKATKLVKGKRTPKNVMKDGKKSVLRSNYSETEDKESSDVSDAEPIISSKLDEVNSGSSEGEDAENVENNLTDGGESDNEVKSVSKEDKEGSPNPMEESDEEKPDAGERPADDRESTPQDAPKSDEEKPDSGERVTDDREGSPQDAPMSDEEIQHSEEEHADESSQSSGEKEQASEEDKSDSEETRETNDVKNTPPKPKKTQKNKPKPAKEDAEISDDEPLMQWKNRVGKKASKHV